MTDMVNLQVRVEDPTVYIVVTILSVYLFLVSFVFQLIDRVGIFLVGGISYFYYQQRQKALLKKKTK